MRSAIRQFSTEQAVEKQKNKTPGPQAAPDTASLDNPVAALPVLASSPFTRLSRVARQESILRMQQTHGNASVLRFLARQQSHATGIHTSTTIQRDDDEQQGQAGGDAKTGDQPPNLTLEDEQNILRTKRDMVQRNVIQRAWTGRRQLGGGAANTVLGRPSVWDRSGNWFNLGLYHQHIFFEDGQAPPDIGHMGKQGLASDTARVGEYSREYTNLNDARMRQAVETNRWRGTPGTYGLFSNNCQAFVARVMDTYNQLTPQSVSNDAGTGSSSGPQDAGTSLNDDSE